MTFAESRIGVTPANAGKTYPVEALSRQEAAALIASCGRGYAGLRDRAGFSLMYRAGLRIAELLALEPKDLDFDEGLVTILHGKGDQRRMIPVDSQAMAQCELWLLRRREIGLDGRHRLYCTISNPNRGTPSWDSVLRAKVKGTARRAGIDKRVTPHSLRHTYATELARENTPVHIIRQLLGHNDLATTERYIAKLHPADLRRVISQRPTWDAPRHAEPAFEPVERAGVAA